MRFMALAALFLLFSGCSSTPEEQPIRPAEELFEEAQSAYDAKQYTKAMKLFDEVERQHPYSNLAPDALIKGAISAYDASKYDDALAIIDRFIYLHPGHKSISDAYYIRAVCYYEQISDVKRDQSMTLKAKQALEDVMQRFPDSSHAKDARIKMDLLREYLAGKEMYIGKYYMNRKQYQAAIGRFTEVVEHYQTTVLIEEALFRLIEAYTMLGLKDEALRTGAILGNNYPKGEWYKKAYNLLTEK